MATWVTAIVLKTLADHGLGRANAQFYGHELKSWVGRQLTEKQRNDVTSRLCSLDFVKHNVRVEPEKGGRVDVYLITSAGAAAIKEAAAGKVHKSGPKGALSGPRAFSDTSLAARLWTLLRMRRAVESDSAAETLCDAGDDHKKVQENVRRYLRRWHSVGAVVEAKKRVRADGTSNGVKRYLISEQFLNQTQPPNWVQLSRTAAEGAPQ